MRGWAPFGVWFDEAEAGLEARRLLAGATFEPISRDFGRDAAAFFFFFFFFFFFSLIAISIGLDR